MRLYDRTGAVGKSKMPRYQAIYGQVANASVSVIAGAAFPP